MVVQKHFVINTHIAHTSKQIVSEGKYGGRKVYSVIYINQLHHIKRDYSR